MTQLRYAFSKMSKELAAMGETGLASAKKVNALVSMFTSQGMSGEEVGSAFQDVLRIGRNAGLFRDLDSMLRYFDRMKNRGKELQKIFGSGSGVSTVVGKLAREGSEGFNRFVKAMDAQADSGKRVRARR